MSKQTQQAREMIRRMDWYVGVGMIVVLALTLWSAFSGTAAVTWMGAFTLALLGGGWWWQRGRFLRQIEEREARERR